MDAKLSAFHLKHNVLGDIKIVLACSLKDACEIANWDFKDITMEATQETKGRVVEHIQNKADGAKTTPTEEQELLKNCF